MTCTCKIVYVGGQQTDSRDWSPDCPEHGTESPWWNSPTQIEKRKRDSERLRRLQLQARDARKKARE